ncbi:MAG TPA: IS256 family transposase [Bacteroidetes bacterium]|nr:IS256 family transposase [Bacteroidota bacterium]
MDKRKKNRSPRMEDLIPDKDRREEVLRRLYQGDDIIGERGIFTDLLQALVNASLDGEMDGHLSSEKENDPTNRRNGKLSKTVRSTVGPLNIETPRDRSGTFDPSIVGKWDREFSTGMDNVILSFYARGQSIEDIRHQLREIYGVEVSAGTITAITNRVWDEIVSWQNRSLNALYCIIYLDAIHYKVREQNQVIMKAVYTVYGINAYGARDVLGLYLSETEGSRHWGLILEDLKRRGVEDVIIFCVDGLKGFKEVIEEVYPLSQVQRCIVHMIRSSIRFVGWKDARAICSDLRKIYSSVNREQALVALEAFKVTWDTKYKEVSKKWEDNWEELMHFMDYSENIRRMIYTTNPVEALHRCMRKVTKSKGAWVNDQALLKQLYLTLMHNEKSWKRTSYDWTPIQRELLEKYEDRYERHLK